MNDTIQTPEVKLSRTQQKLQNNRLEQEHWASRFKGPQGYQASQRKAAINNLTNPNVVLSSKEKRNLMRTGVDVGFYTRQEPKDSTRKVLRKLNGRSMERLGVYQQRAIKRATRLQLLIDRIEATPVIGEGAVPSATQVKNEATQEGIFGFLGRMKKGLKKGFDAIAKKTAVAVAPSSKPARISKTLDILKAKHAGLVAFGRCVNAVIKYRFDNIENIQMAKAFARQQNLATAGQELQAAIKA